MTDPKRPRHEDLVAFLADDDDASLDATRRGALEAELDQAVDGAMEAYPMLEPSPSFERDLFERLDAIDEGGTRSLWTRLQAWLTWPRAGLAVAALAAVFLVVRSTISDPPGPSSSAPPLAQVAQLELAEDLELYENLDVLENMDVLDDLAVIEALEEG